MFLDFEKRKKDVQKRTYSLRGHLITPRSLKHDYRKSVPVMSSTSNISAQKCELSLDTL